MDSAVTADLSTDAARAADASAGSLQQAIERTSRWLLHQQHADGHWCAELEGDSILESEYILLLAYLGRHNEPVALQAARYLLDCQNADGGWSQYPGGELDISSSVKAYFALKLTGQSPSSEPMQRARQAILAHGGADAVNSFTRYYLALLGQIPYRQCPVVPAEVLLIPQWVPWNLYAMSSWSRTILVPLAVLSAFRPVTQLKPEHCIRELFILPPEQWPLTRSPGLAPGDSFWTGFFGSVDRLLHFLERKRWLPLRRKALQAAERWIVERFAGSDGLGAIFPPMIWSIVALRCLGYAEDSPELTYCYERLDGLILRDRSESGEERVRLQPCKSPVWDTSISLRALLEAGLPSSSPAAQACAEWLLKQEIQVAGDYAQTVKTAPGGWCFEYANDFYPDVDDTSMVLMALARQTQLTATGTSPSTEQAWLSHTRGPADASLLTQTEHAQRAAQAIERGTQWMLAMQNRDGGWGAFDKNNDRELLCHVPFADHNAMIDPSTPDLAGRVLESLGTLGFRIGAPAVDRAVEYLLSKQEADGSWFGRWGVNHIYGTWQVLTGLAAVGIPTSHSAMEAGAQWLLACQQPCGGWGESPRSYEDRAWRGRGCPTASQTAWALLGLLAAGFQNHAAVERGATFLLSHQNVDGSWDEPEFTGTGFPRVFYLRYHYYRIYFPLLALARVAAARGVSIPMINEAEESGSSIPSQAS